MPVPMWPTESWTNWMPCNGRCSNILNLSPCDFHVFGPLKEGLKCSTFTLDNNVQKAVVEWIKQQPKEFFADGICWLVHQWDACLNSYGDFKLSQYLQPWAFSNGFHLNVPCTFWNNLTTESLKNMGCMWEEIVFFH
jgi:hypothetical protein